MNAKNEILEELRLLSAVVNDISRETPYRVPAGYFDGFPALMLSLTGEAAGAERPFFATEKDKSLISKDMPQISQDMLLTFSVPEGYFEGFAKGVLDKIKAGDQITARQPGSGISPDSRQNEGSSDPGSNDPSRELAQLSPLLNGISRKLPYQAPEGYFEELSPIMAPLAEVRQKPSYSVPEGYFEGLAAEILSKVSPAKVKEPASVVSESVTPAPVISMNRKSPMRSPMSLSQRSFWKYSAAAVVAGLIFTIGWLRLQAPGKTHHPAQVADVTSNLVKISDQDLQNFLDNQNDQESDVNSRDDNSADDNSATAEPMNSTATLDITDSDVKSLLGDVPDGELKSYMEEHGGASDIATN